MKHSAKGDKLFYRMGEVCTMLALEPHVLRFWESEFPQLKPGKNRSGHRIFKKEDISLIRRIRKLLHEEGFTIAGARRFLEGEDLPAKPLALDKDWLLDEIGEIKNLLENSLKLLDEGRGGA